MVLVNYTASQLKLQQSRCVYHSKQLCMYNRLGGMQSGSQYDSEGNELKLWLVISCHICLFTAEHDS